MIVSSQAVHTLGSMLRTPARHGQGHRGTRYRASARLLAAAAALAAPAACAPAAATSPGGLPYSTASASVVQRQPSAGSCHARGSGVNTRPDARCTPGALNPTVTQSTISATICHGGWTKTVRPTVSITEPEKLASMRSYGDTRSASSYEYDHLVPLELGGAVNDRRNLWPEPNAPGATGFYKNPKDELERALNRLVCRGRMRLSQAQQLIASDWVGAFRRYG
jgi:hypothetical protein